MRMEYARALFGVPQDTRRAEAQAMNPGQIGSLSNG